VIAAYKAPELVRALTAEGLEVQVLLTPAAESFVTRLSLATVSRRPVRLHLLDTEEEGHVSHIELADWPDLVLVAPATADLIARAAGGLANDLVSTCLLATRAPVLWAPAMNTNMWRHPATQSNLGTLAARGATFVGPDRGELACGWVGEGRMVDPQVIVEAVLDLLSSKGLTGSAWSGRRVLVSAGPTRAHIDPVRFVTNASTGAMGFAVAAAAQRRGAEVTLVAGPVDRPTPAGVRRLDVCTGEEMLRAMSGELERGGYDLVAMVAAVADVVPEEVSDTKIEKPELLRRLDGLSWGLAADILATLTRKRASDCIFLGFAAETVDLEDEADVVSALRRAGVAKMRAKGCRALFVNRVAAPGVGFASDTNAGILLLDGEGEPEALPSGPPIAKAELAAWILDRIGERLLTKRGDARG
jgi:phosphopantothenoylcysteine decarboxylase/phosphopantothenate--cysteine ligase